MRSYFLVKQLRLSFSSTGIHCLPATPLAINAANENHFRCFASSAQSSKKNSYGMRKCLRKFVASLESRRFSSAFLNTVNHDAWKKSDRGWPSRVRSTSGITAINHRMHSLPPPWSPPMYTISSIITARPEPEPTPPRSRLGAVSCRIELPLESDSERYFDAFVVVVRRHEMSLRVV